MTPTDKDRVKIQTSITAGLTFDESGLDPSLRPAWDAMTAEIASMSSHGISIEVVTEWSDMDADAVSALYGWSDEELADYEQGIMLDERGASPTMVSKSVDERRFTLGPMYIPNRLDAHNEWTDPDELQKAVWEYMRKGDRRIRLQHNRDVVAGEALEIMAWPYEVQVPMVMKDATTQPVTFPANTVFLGVQWEPWAWEMVKADKLRGYSIGGRAQRLLVDLPDESAQ